jgi:hypothetical protein
MQEWPSKNDDLFRLICRLLGEDERWRCRLVRSQEIVVCLLQSDEARAVIEAARRHRPDSSAEQLAGNIVASFGQSAIVVGSEWQSLVEALQISGEWFFRLKPQVIDSHESTQTGTQRAV